MTVTAPPGGETTPPAASTNPPASANPPASTNPPTSGTPPAPTTTPSTVVVVGKDTCKSDSDCLPATCCGATECVAPSKALDCSAVRCRRNCDVPNVACGGGCLCQGGLCAARLGTDPN